MLCKLVNAIKGVNQMEKEQATLQDEANIQEEQLKDINHHQSADPFGDIFNFRNVLFATIILGVLILIIYLFI